MYPLLKTRALPEPLKLPPTRSWSDCFFSMSKEILSLEGINTGLKKMFYLWFIHEAENAFNQRRKKVSCHWIRKASYQLVI